MKKYLMTFLLVGWFCNVYADTVYYNGPSNTVSSFNSEQIVVNNGAVISAPVDVITVDYAAVDLYNHGTINGQIYTANRHLIIHNDGVITDGVVIDNPLGRVTQKISSDTEITNLNVTGNTDRFSVEIRGLTEINLDDIRAINASAFTIGQSSVVINDFAKWQEWNKSVELDGPITLIITDANTVVSGTVIKHTVSGDTVNVQIIGLDSSVKTSLKDTGEGLILMINRETDYTKVFDNAGQESVLEQIRQNNPNDKLLQKLDNANDVDEINRLKKLSYRFNHDILLRPIKVIHNFAIVDILKDKTDTGAGFTPWYIVSDKMQNIGGRLYIGHAFNDLYFNVGFNLNRFEYKDDINTFSGFTYGLDTKLKQKIGNLWFAGNAGLSLTKFKADYIYYDDKVKHNPLGFSGYGALSVGYDIDVMSDFIITPFAETVYQKYKVLDATDSDWNMFGGAEAKYSFVMDGIKYEYSLSGAIGTNGDIFSTLKIGFWSVTDDAGAALNVSMFKNDLDYNYQFGINAKILF